MRTVVTSLLLLLGASAAVHRRTMDMDSLEDIDYEALLTNLWNQTDVDENGKLSFQEFQVAWDKLGIDVSILTEHNQDLQVFFDELDANADGGLTPEELAAAVQNYEYYAEPLISSFTNGAGTVPDDLTEPSDGMLAAHARVVWGLEIAGPPSEIYPGQREAIVEYLASLFGVDSSLLVVTFLPAGSRRELEGLRRRLDDHEAAMNTQVEAIAFVPDAESLPCDGCLPSSTAELQGEAAFAGLEVVAVAASVETVEEQALEVTTAAAGAALLLVVLLLGPTLSACYCARRKHNNNFLTAGNAEGCCTTGCCSFNAVSTWACWHFVFALTLIAAVAGLYVRMQDTTDSFVGVVESVIDFSHSANSFIQDLSAEMPDEVIDVLEEHIDKARLAPFFVMGPGVVAVLFMLLSALLPCSARRPGSYCWSKCANLFAYVFLLVALAFYLLLVVLATLVHDPTLFPDDAGAQFEEDRAHVRALCQTTTPRLLQLISDNSLTLDMLAAHGQNVTEFAQTIDNIEELVMIVDGGCDHLEGFWPATVRLFAPAAVCVVALFCALYMNTALCVAEGCCCWGPPTEGRGAGGGGGGATYSASTSSSASDGYSSTKNPFAEGLARA